MVSVGGPAGACFYELEEFPAAASFEENADKIFGFRVDDVDNHAFFEFERAPEAFHDFRLCCRHPLQPADDLQLSAKISGKFPLLIGEMLFQLCIQVKRIGFYLGP